MPHASNVKIGIQMPTKDYKRIPLPFGLHLGLELPFPKWNGAHPSKKKILDKPKALHIKFYMSKWPYNKCETCKRIFLTSYPKFSLLESSTCLSRDGEI
jgi:hypothetical protein